ncbi:polyprenyl synthetase family protein [Microbacterium sp. NPDC055903]
MRAVTIREDLHSAIEDRLRHRLDARAAAAEPYGAEFMRLWRLTGDRVLGGKLLRPRLVVELHAALAAERLEEPTCPSTTVLDLAVAVELLHYSFLLHDDVIDGDVQRRHSPNLIAALRDEHPNAERRAGEALHWGRTGAILMGDLLLADVHQRFARADVPSEQRMRILDLLDHTITETVVGEQLDVALGDHVVSADLHTILSMSEYKTATYTFEFPLRLAAIIAGRDNALETDLAAIARHLGLAFQLQDDLLSVFGEGEEHGKDPYSDLREGKQTALVAYARMTSTWVGIETRFGAADLTEQEGAGMRDALRACGAERFVQSLVDEQLSAAYALIADAEASGALPPAARRVLTALTDRLEGRRA